MCFQINKALFNQKYVSGLSAWQQDGRCAAAAVLSASRRLLYILCPSFFVVVFVFSLPLTLPPFVLRTLPPHPPPTPTPLPLPPACV